MEGVMAVITTVAYDFSPKNWAYCDGQLLAINTNQALFSLLGTTYGGNGINTFGLPNLKGRCPISPGNSTTGSTYVLGQVSGSETATLSINNMPAHNHNGSISLALNASSGYGSDSNPEGDNLASGIANTYSTNADTNLLSPTYQTIVGTAGSSQPFSIISPYLVLNYVICMYGVFPSRN